MDDGYEAAPAEEYHSGYDLLSGASTGAGGYDHDLVTHAEPLRRQGPSTPHTYVVGGDVPAASPLLRHPSSSLSLGPSLDPTLSSTAKSRLSNKLSKQDSNKNQEHVTFNSDFQVGQ